MCKFYFSLHYIKDKSCAKRFVDIMPYTIKGLSGCLKGT